MSLDTRKLILRHQVLDLLDFHITLSGVEAREIIEDHLNNALTAGNNVSISYDDVPDPGIVEIGTTESLIINNLTSSGIINFGTLISGTGDIYCNDIYTSGSTVHIGDYIELSDTGSALSVNAPIFAGGSESKIEFSTSSGTIGVSGKTDLMELTTSGINIDGWLMADSVSLADGATGWFDDGINFRIIVTDGIITNIGTTVSGGYYMA